MHVAPTACRLLAQTDEFAQRGKWQIAALVTAKLALLRTP